ncbi:MAG: stage III sporulation protein AE [Oscillospiraceae bacterium]|nr:stage III sporulation protein AE [Oscillospiraceae bacterium]
MKNTRMIICGILVLFSISGFARAEPADRSAVVTEAEDIVPPAIAEQSEVLDTESVTDALPQDAKKILGDLSLTDTDMGNKGFQAVLDTIKESIFGIFKNALSSAAKIMTIVVLCTAATSAMSEGGVRDMVSLGGTVAVSAIAISNVNSFIGMGVKTLTALSDFSKALLPVMCSAAASAGAITSASAKYAATALFMDILLTISVNIMLPLISLYLAAVIANAALPKDSLANVAKLLKWICTTGLTLLMTGFTAYLGMTGLISGKADEVATRLAKTALGTALPVVGSIISDTAETLVAGAGIIRNAIGVFGFLAVAAICLTPFLSLGLHYLVYKGTAAFTEAMADKRLAELVSDVGAAFGMLLALVGCGGIMLFFSILSSMKAVTGI